ncbi:MAG TPA: hypothetical protein VFR18_14525 [Terriglobia bacterium]|nr:hypothetical protein [Terriglobia bacterium]
MTLPPSLQTSRSGNTQPPGWPQDVAPLPTGFRPVRLERGPEVSVAVSVSRMLDPVGEISEGGYWIHISQDGGKSWQPPVYTGLAQFFPYVVPSISKLPLSAGDRLQLEVEVQEIDTSSITYPPVDLRSSRRAQNLYLELSLAALQSDKDRDGLTDIVEERLLLDPEMADSDGDGLADGVDPLPNVKSAAEVRDAADPIAAILKSIYGMPEGAIVEPVDGDANAGFLGKPAGPPTPLRPLLVQGRPEDFRAGIPGAQVLVYSDIDVQKLRAKSPDFNGLTLQAAVFNRAGDRGFVVWSFGWTGGTLRLIREPGGWRTEAIRNWIS